MEYDLDRMKIFHWWLFLSIQVDENTVRPVSGLCGRFSSKKVLDLVDRQGCLYNQSLGEVFAVSTIVGSLEQCRSRSSPEVQRVIDQYKQYEVKCPKTLQGLQQLNIRPQQWFVAIIRGVKIKRP